ncbi:hypothetical protein AB4156_41045, partial [Cupriavidus sp. 2MCAB6]|uniref:hypothetical protein n=1 Tax=Cupriavidus sp. 2MCAB6 TaxID=3232981 RepID=UPI003F91C2A7
MQISVNQGQFENDIIPDRRTAGQVADRSIGRVLSCNGARATIGTIIPRAGTATPEAWTIGRMISINLGRSRIVGMVYAEGGRTYFQTGMADNPVHIEVELLGEVLEAEGGRTYFQTGITTYPPVGAIAHRIRALDLA